MSAEERAECYFQRAHIVPGAYPSHTGASAANQRGCRVAAGCSTALLTLRR